MEAFDQISPESARLAALHGLAQLDTEPEPIIDHITRLAAKRCEAPFALVTLVDEKRQWVKSNYGLDGFCGSPRQFAACDLTIRSDEVLVVEDTLTDRRFRNNPMVGDENGLRFYAGAPLLLEDGVRLGSLCVLDLKPRQLDPAKRALLSQLAAATVEILSDRQLLVGSEAALLYIDAATGQVVHANTFARSALETAELDPGDCKLAQLIPNLDVAKALPLHCTGPDQPPLAALPALNWDQVRLTVALEGPDGLLCLRASKSSSVSQPTQTAVKQRRTPEEFIVCANAVLIEQGYGNFSVRKVAKAADVGVGHLQHYFPTKTALLSAMIDWLSKMLWQHYDQHIAPVNNPVDRLLACADFVLEDGSRFGRARLLREYAVLSQHEPKIAQVVTAYFSQCRQMVFNVLTEIHPQLSRELADARASEIVALLSSAFIFTQSWDSSGVVPGYGRYLRARMVELTHFPALFSPNQPAEKVTNEQRIIESLLNQAESLALSRHSENTPTEICGTVTQALNCDRASIYLLELGKFWGRYNVGNSAEVAERFEQQWLSPVEPLIAKAINSRACAMVEDASVDPLIGAALAEQLPGQALMVAPILDSKRAVLGLLIAEYDAHTGALEGSQEQALLGLARLAAVVLA